MLLDSALEYAEYICEDIILSKANRTLQSLLSSQDMGSSTQLVQQLRGKLARRAYLTAVRSQNQPHIAKGVMSREESELCKARAEIVSSLLHFFELRRAEYAASVEKLFYPLAEYAMQVSYQHFLV